MPLFKLKRVWDYTSYNIVFFIFIGLIIFLFNLLPDYSMSYFGFEVGGIVQILVWVFINGYGMIITRDRINHGYRLPKIIPGDVINLGIKSTVVYGFYICLQTVLMLCLTYVFNIPVFDLHELLWKFNETIQMFTVNTPQQTLTFILLGGIVFYITSFWAEIGLARLADTKSFFAAFNFRAIYKSLRIFGFRKYIWDYTSIILVITILTFIKSINLSNFALDSTWEIIFGLLIFTTQYLGIGAIYCEIKDAEFGRDRVRNSS